MAITKGQTSSVGATATSSCTCTFGTNPTAGHSILIAAATFNGSAFSATDNASPSSNTYSVCTDGTHSANVANGGIRVGILKCDTLKLPSSGSLVVTVTATGGGATIGFAEEIIGNTTGNVEFAATATGSANPEAVASGGGSTDDLYWGVSADNAASGSVTYTYGNSFTQEAHEGDNNNFQDMAVGSKGFGGGTSGTQTYSATSSPSNSQWAATVVAIKTSGGGTTPIAGAPVLKFSAGATAVEGKALTGPGALKFGAGATAAVAKALTGPGALKFGTTGTLNAATVTGGAPLLTFGVRGQPAEAIAAAAAPVVRLGAAGNLQQGIALGGDPLLRFGATGTLSAAGSAQLLATPILRFGGQANLVKFERVTNAPEEYRRPRRWLIWP